MVVVSFKYFTGIRGNFFESATLLGSWDSRGNYSGQFLETPMRSATGIDNCPSFQAELQFPDSEIGQTFRWGVRLRRGGSDVWGIAEEVNDGAARENVCSFVLQSGAEGQTESYRLNWSRHLGSQKVVTGPGARPRIQFAVWAPQAKKVEVVMGDFLDSAGGASAIDPNRSPAMKPVHAADVSGGYIGDGGEGMHPAWGPFSMSMDAAGVTVLSTTKCLLS